MSAGFWEENIGLTTRALVKPPAPPTTVPDYWAIAIRRQWGLMAKPNLLHENGEVCLATSTPKVLAAPQGRNTRLGLAPLYSEGNTERLSREYGSRSLPTFMTLPRTPPKSEVFLLFDQKTAPTSRGGLILPCGSQRVTKKWSHVAPF